MSDPERAMRWLDRFAAYAGEQGAHARIIKERIELAEYGEEAWHQSSDATLKRAMAAEAELRKAHENIDQLLAQAKREGNG